MIVECTRQHEQTVAQFLSVALVVHLVYTVSNKRRGVGGDNGMLCEQVKQQIVALLTEAVQPAFIVLFGSYAKNTARSDSDVDIAYYSEQSISPYNRFIMMGELAMICGAEVDLINIREVDTVFAMQIFAYGQLLACSDENEFVKQRMKALRMYVELNEQREVVLQSIRESWMINKVATIERCMKRIQEVYDNNPANLQDYTKQDSIILNIQRACEATIDIAMHLVSEQKLGVPKASRDAFKLLQEAGIIEGALAQTLIRMVGFRNIAVHDYQSLDIGILQSILDLHIVDFYKFTKAMISKGVI